MGSPPPLPSRGDEGVCAPKLTATEVPNGDLGQDRYDHGTTPPARQEKDARALKSTATEMPVNGKTIAEGHGAEHWRRMAPERNNPQEVAAARLKLAEEIMGKEATKKLELRGLVFPRWQAAWHPAATMLREPAM